MSDNQRIAKLPIGVFDSGMGGLTVLRAMKALLPAESYVYLGDTARLPYGTKSQATVSRYALQAAAKLVEVGVKAIVVACNTASATALPALQARFPDLPIYGVVIPGADAAASGWVGTTTGADAAASGWVGTTTGADAAAGGWGGTSTGTDAAARDGVGADAEARRSGGVALLATEGTVQGGAYQRALLVRGVTKIRARAAPLLVALAEEGVAGLPLRDAVLQHYVRGLVCDDVSTLLLGCTHFPVFADRLRELLGTRVRIVDSARTTAESVARTLLAHPGDVQGETLYMATDGLERFRRVGEVFLGANIDGVELVDV